MVGVLIQETRRTLLQGGSQVAKASLKCKHLFDRIALCGGSELITKANLTHGVHTGGKRAIMKLSIASPGVKDCTNIA